MRLPVAGGAGGDYRPEIMAQAQPGQGIVDALFQRDGVGDAAHGQPALVEAGDSRQAVRLHDGYVQLGAEHDAGQLMQEVVRNRESERGQRLAD